MVLATCSRLPLSRSIGMRIRGHLSRHAGRKRALQGPGLSLSRPVNGRLSTVVYFRPPHNTTRTPFYNGQPRVWKYTGRAAVVLLCSSE